MANRDRNSNGTERWAPASDSRPHGVFSTLRARAHHQFDKHHNGVFSFHMSRGHPEQHPDDDHEVLHDNPAQWSPFDPKSMYVDRNQEVRPRVMHALGHPDDKRFSRGDLDNAGNSFRGAWGNLRDGASSTVKVFKDPEERRDLERRVTEKFHESEEQASEWLHKHSKQQPREQLAHSLSHRSSSRSAPRRSFSSFSNRRQLRRWRRLDRGPDVRRATGRAGARRGVNGARDGAVQQRGEEEDGVVSRE